MKTGPLISKMAAEIVELAAELANQKEINQGLRRELSKLNRIIAAGYDVESAESPESSKHPIMNHPIKQSKWRLSKWLIFKWGWQYAISESIRA